MEKIFDFGWIRNCKPELFALILNENFPLQGENQTIEYSDTGNNAFEGQIFDIHLRKKDSVYIQVMDKTKNRANLETNLNGKNDLLELIHLLERERTHSQITLMQRERLHLLGTSPWQASFFPETNQLPTDQKNILAFFLPYRSQIRGDMVLTRVCMQEAIGQPIELQLTSPKVQHYPGGRIDDTTVDLDLVIGGFAPKEVPCLKVLLGPVPMAKVHEFVPGGHQRKFLEQAFLPCFLPEGWDWEVQIIVAEAGRKFQPSTEEEPALYIDINAIVN